VAALWFGLDVTAVTIRRTAHEGGHCRIPDLDRVPAAGIMVLVAGPCAQAKFLNARLNDAVWANDRERALALAEKIASGQAPAVVQAMIEAGHGLVRANWRTIESIARLLLERETLGAVRLS
jgi:hypothetical protein